MALTHNTGHATLHRHHTPDTPQRKSHTSYLNTKITQPHIPRAPHNALISHEISRNTETHMKQASVENCRAGSGAHKSGAHYFLKCKKWCPQDGAHLLVHYKTRVRRPNIMWPRLMGTGFGDFERALQTTLPSSPHPPATFHLPLSHPKLRSATSTTIVNQHQQLSDPSPHTPMGRDISQFVLGLLMRTTK